MNSNIIILILVRLLLFKWFIYRITNFGKQNLMVLFLKEINYKTQTLIIYNLKYLILIKKMKNLQQILNLLITKML